MSCRDLYETHGVALAHDEIDLAPARQLPRLPVPRLAETLTRRPGPVDRELFAFVAERHVAIEPPTDEHPVWDVRVRGTGGWLLATAPDLPSALLTLWRRLAAVETPTATVRPMGVA